VPVCLGSFIVSALGHCACRGGRGVGHPALVLSTGARLRITAAAHATLEALETKCVHATFAVKASTFGYHLTRTMALDNAKKRGFSCMYMAWQVSSAWRGWYHLPVPTIREPWARRRGHTDSSCYVSGGHTRLRQHDWQILLATYSHTCLG
jgi:hypothetical protein